MLLDYAVPEHVHTALSSVNVPMPPASASSAQSFLAFCAVTLPGISSTLARHMHKVECLGQGEGDRERDPTTHSISNHGGIM